VVCFVHTFYYQKLKEETSITQQPYKGIQIYENYEDTRFDLLKITLENKKEKTVKISEDGEEYQRKHRHRHRLKDD